jgi:hypothetical protein
MTILFSNIKLVLILVNVILGISLLYSYYYYIKTGGVSGKILWGRSYSVRKLYIASMILAAIGYLLVLGFSIFKTVDSSKNRALLSNLIIIQILILVMSMLWLPLTLDYIKGNRKPLTMIAVVIVLFIVGISAFKQMKLIQQLTPENTQCAKMTQTASVMGAGVFFIHTFFFDFIGWSAGFFS